MCSESSSSAGRELDLLFLLHGVPLEMFGTGPPVCSGLSWLGSRCMFGLSVLLCERSRRGRGPQPCEPFQRPQRQKCCSALLLCGEPPTLVADGGFLLHTCPAIKQLSKTHAQDACTPTLPHAQLCSKLDLFGILHESEARSPPSSPSSLSRCSVGTAPCFHPSPTLFQAAGLWGVSGFVFGDSGCQPGVRQLSRAHRAD